MKLLSLFVLTAALTVAAPLTAAEPVPPKSHPDTADWDRLLAEDLGGAQYPEGIWSFEDGVLTATEDQCIWTKKEYDDFILDLDVGHA